MMLTWAVVIHCEIWLLLSLSFYSSASGSRILLMFVSMSVQLWVTFLLHRHKKKSYKPINSAVKLIWISQVILEIVDPYCKILRNKIIWVLLYAHWSEEISWVQWFGDQGGTWNLFRTSKLWGKFHFGRRKAWCLCKNVERLWNNKGVTWLYTSGWYKLWLPELLLMASGAQWRMLRLCLLISVTFL